MKKSSFGTTVILMFAILSTLPAIAEERKEVSPDQQDVRNSQEIQGEAAPTSTHAITTPTVEGAASESDSNRMKTLEGSKSAWSGQLNLTYNGSTISHPFSKEAPNSGGQVPPPLVTLSGTGSARYRLDSQTTMGLGTGVTTQTPFQGPKNTTVADPYVDVARSWKTNALHDRLDFQLTRWTNDQSHGDYGYNWGASLANDLFHTFGFGLTAGFVFELDANLFGNDAKFDTAKVRGNQTRWDIITDPYFEYVLSKRVNLRTVIGIQSLNNRDLDGGCSFFHPKVYESFGLGVQITSAWFIYPFVEFFPYDVQSNKTLVGLNTIINLF